jgi:hypothetical protein
MKMNDIPKGFKEVKNATAYINEEIGRLAILGQPNDDDESHYCDYMGCSSISHVLYIGRVSRR